MKDSTQGCKVSRVTGSDGGGGEDIRQQGLMIDIKNDAQAVGGRRLTGSRVCGSKQRMRHQIGPIRAETAAKGTEGDTVGHDGRAEERRQRCASPSTGRAAFGGTNQVADRSVASTEPLKQSGEIGGGEGVGIRHRSNQEDARRG
jgi:hypothetical protein